MTPTPEPVSTFLGMSDQFWSSVAGALVGALAAGAISVAVAIGIFRAEKNRRTHEQQEQDWKAIRAARANAAAHLISVVNKWSRPYGSGLAPVPLAISTAHLALIAFDPSDEALRAYDFVTQELGKAYPDSPRHKSDIEIAGSIESALIYWIRHDPPASFFDDHLESPLPPAD
jgi:hypothetical protein